MKALYYGNNLQVLRDGIATESVDLIYLDPPFNSNATYTYNVRCWRVSRPQFRAAACPLLAEGVEEVPRARIFETMIQNPGRYQCCFKLSLPER